MNATAEDTPIVIRRARADEAEAIVALIHRAFAQYRGVLKPEPSALSESVGKIATEISSNIVLVAVVDERLVGCVAVQRRGDRIYARRLAVDPALRGAGIGKALMAQAEAVARGLGANRLRVETRLALAGNRAFFRALGFAEGQHQCHPGFAEPTYLELEKSLI